MTTPATCEACGAPIARHDGPGRPRRFCCATCRSRAQQRRWGALVGFLGAGPELLRELDAALTDDVLELPANSDEATLHVLSEALALVVKLERTAERARPEFRPHLEFAAAALAGALESWSEAFCTTLSAPGEPVRAESGDDHCTISETRITVSQEVSR
jgi:hypothetical protein